MEVVEHVVGGLSGVEDQVWGCTSGFEVSEFAVRVPVELPVVMAREDFASPDIACVVFAGDVDGVSAEVVVRVDDVVAGVFAETCEADGDAVWQALVRVPVE